MTFLLVAADPAIVFNPIVGHEVDGGVGTRFPADREAAARHAEAVDVSLRRLTRINLWEAELRIQVFLVTLVIVAVQRQTDADLAIDDRTIDRGILLDR